MNERSFSQDLAQFDMVADQFDLGLPVFPGICLLKSCSVSLLSMIGSISLWLTSETPRDPLIENFSSSLGVPGGEMRIRNANVATYRLKSLICANRSSTKCDIYEIWDRLSEDDLTVANANEDRIDWHTIHAQRIERCHHNFSVLAPVGELTRRDGRRLIGPPQRVS